MLILTVLHPYWGVNDLGMLGAAKLENARVLYENTDKTAAEVCGIARVGRRTFFAYLTERTQLLLS